VKGYNSRNKKVILYLNFPSALHTIVHGPKVPVPQPIEILEDASINSCDSGGDNEEFHCHIESPQLFTQSELNDVIRHLGLPKEKAEPLGSRLKENNLSAAGTSMYWYRSREKEFLNYFSEDGDLVYCCNIPRLIKKFGLEYKVH
jgi:hypothetical protein